MSNPFFQLYDEFVRRLERTGELRVLKDVLRVRGCINGLTDGWVDAYETLLSVRTLPMTPGSAELLDRLLAGFAWHPLPGAPVIAPPDLSLNLDFELLSDGVVERIDAEFAQLGIFNEGWLSVRPLCEELKTALQQGKSDAHADLLSTWVALVDVLGSESESDRLPSVCRHLVAVCKGRYDDPCLSPTQREHWRKFAGAVDGFRNRRTSG